MALLIWNQDVAGSNPIIPTYNSLQSKEFFYFKAFSSWVLIDFSLTVFKTGEEISRVEYKSRYSSFTLENDG